MIRVPLMESSYLNTSLKTWKTKLSYKECFKCIPSITTTCLIIIDHHPSKPHIVVQYIDCMYVNIQKIDIYCVICANITHVHIIIMNVMSEEGKTNHYRNHYKISQRKSSLCLNDTLKYELSKNKINRLSHTPLLIVTAKTWYFQ